MADNKQQGKNPFLDYTQEELAEWVEALRNSNIKEEIREARAKREAEFCERERREAQRFHDLMNDDTVYGTEIADHVDHATGR